jgi:hypothetical protein
MAYHLDVLRHFHAGTAPGRVEVHDERHLPLSSHHILQFLGRHLLLQRRAKENSVVRGTGSREREQRARDFRHRGVAQRTTR